MYHDYFQEEAARKDSFAPINEQVLMMIKAIQSRLLKINEKMCMEDPRGAHEQIKKLQADLREMELGS